REPSVAAAVEGCPSTTVWPIPVPGSASKPIRYGRQHRNVCIFVFLLAGGERHGLCQTWCGPLRVASGGLTDCYGRIERAKAVPQSIVANRKRYLLPMLASSHFIRSGSTHNGGAAYIAMMRSIALRHTAQNPASSRVNMMQSACGR